MIAPTVGIFGLVGLVGLGLCTGPVFRGQASRRQNRIAYVRACFLVSFGFAGMCVRIVMACARIRIRIFVSVSLGGAEGFA